MALLERTKSGKGQIIDASMVSILSDCSKRGAVALSRQHLRRTCCFDFPKYAKVFVLLVSTKNNVNKITVETLCIKSRRAPLGSGHIQTDSSPSANRLYARCRINEAVLLKCKPGGCFIKQHKALYAPQRQHFTIQKSSRSNHPNNVCSLLQCSICGGDGALHCRRLGDSYTICVGWFKQSLGKLFEMWILLSEKKRGSYSSEKLCLSIRSSHFSDSSNLLKMFSWIQRWTYLNFGGQWSMSRRPHVLVNVIYKHQYGISLHLAQTFTSNQRGPESNLDVKVQGHCDLTNPFFITWIYFI